MKRNKYAVIILTAAFATGCGVGQGPGIPLWTVSAFAFCLGAGWGVFYRRAWSPALCILAVIMLGVFCARAHAVPAFDDLRRFDGALAPGRIWIEGEIAGDIRRGTAWSRQSFFVQAARIGFDGETLPVSGRVLVQAYGQSELKDGDRVRCRGRWERLSSLDRDGTSSYDEYLARQGVAFVLTVSRRDPIEQRAIPMTPRRFLRSVRYRCLGIFDRYLPGFDSGVMRALLFGDRGRLSSDLRDLFQRVGISHVLAISGLHIGIATGIFFILAGFFPGGMRARSIVTMAALLGYAALIGERPSVLRACVMAAMFFVSFLVERPRLGLHVLAVAGWVTLSVNPGYIADLGFQLSFAAVGGIMVLFAVIEAGLRRIFPVERESFGDRMIQSVAVDLSAWLGVAGLVAYWFHHITWWALAANMIVVPLTGFLIASGFLLLAVGILCPAAAALVAVNIQAALRLLIASAVVFRYAPGACWVIPPPTVPLVVIYYLVLIAGAVILRRCWIDKHRGL